MYVTFKGSPSEYVSLHYWVKKKLGKPSRCEKCKTTDTRVYDWANISGKYKKDINDWMRLCRSCHLKKDFYSPFCIYGHPRNKINNYIRPDGYIECKVCKKIKRKDFYWKNKKSITIAKISDAQVIEIRSLYKNMKVVQIAKKFDISPQYVTNIVHGRRKLLVHYDK